METDSTRPEFMPSARHVTRRRAWFSNLLDVTVSELVDFVCLLAI